MLRNAFYLNLLLLVLFTGCSQTSHNQLADLPSINIRKFSRLAGSKKYRNARETSKYDMVAELYGDELHIALYNIALKGSDYEKESIAKFFYNLKEYDSRWYIDLLHSENFAVRNIAYRTLMARADTSITQYLIPMLENENSDIVSSTASLLAYYMNEKAIPLLIQQRNRIGIDVLKYYGEPAAEQIVTALDRGEAFSPLLLSDFIFNPGIEQALSNFVSDSTTDQKELEKLGRFMVEKGDSLSINFLAKHADRGNGELYIQLYQYEHLFDSIPYPISDSLLFTFTDTRVKTSIAKFMNRGDYSSYWSKLRECYGDKGDHRTEEFANLIIAKDTSGAILDSIINDYNNYQITPLAALKALRNISSPEKYLFAEQFISHSKWNVNNEITGVVKGDSSAGALMLNKKRLSYSIKKKNKEILNQVIFSLKSVSTSAAADIVIDALKTKSGKEVILKYADNNLYDLLAASGNPRGVPYLVRGLETIRDGADLFSIFRSMKVIDDERLVEPLLFVIQNSYNEKYYFSYHGFRSEILEKGQHLLAAMSSEKAKMAFISVAEEQGVYGWNADKNIIPFLKRNYSEKNRATVVNWVFENRKHKKIYEPGLTILPTVVGKSKQFALLDRLKRMDSTTPEHLSLYLRNCDYRGDEAKLFELMPSSENRYYYSTALAKVFHNELCDGFELIRLIQEKKINDFRYGEIFSSNRYSGKLVASKAFYRDVIMKLDSAGMIRYTNSSNELSEQILKYILNNDPESYQTIIDKYLAEGSEWKDNSRKHPLFKTVSKGKSTLPNKHTFLGHYQSGRYLKRIMEQDSSTNWVEHSLLSVPYLHESTRKNLHNYFEKCGDSIKEQLLTASRSENWKLRERSLYYLSRIDESECRKRMKELTDDPVYAVRMKSLFYLRAL